MLPRVFSGVSSGGGAPAGTGIAIVVGGAFGATLAIGAAFQTVRVNAAANAFECGAVNLAAAAATSGTLPLASVGSPTGTGLAKVSAGGWVGAAALLVDADVDAAAAIAASKVVQATGTGIPHVVAGVLSAASSLIVDADVNAAAAIAGSKISPLFGAQAIQGASLDTAAAGALQLAPTNATSVNTIVPVTFKGATLASQRITFGDSSTGNKTPAAVALIALPYHDPAASTTCVVMARRDSAGTDRSIVTVGGGDQLVFGTVTAVTTQVQGSTLSLVSPAITMTSSGVNVLVTSSTQLKAGVPIVGSATAYGVHGKKSVATAGNFTVASTDYIFDTIRLTDNSTATVTFPQPASDAGAYTKFIANASLNTKTITTGAGATVALLATTGGEICFDNSIGCFLKSAAVAVT